MIDTDPAKIDIRTAPGKWVVYSHGGIFGETRNALQLFQPGRDPMIFIPREDVAMAFFDPSETTAQDARIGWATFYSIDGRSQVLSDAAWSYEDPMPGAERLRGLDEAAVDAGHHRQHGHHRERHPGMDHADHAAEHVVQQRQGLVDET